MHTADTPPYDFYSALKLRIDGVSGSELLNDIKTLAEGHGLDITRADAEKFFEKFSKIKKAELTSEETDRAIARAFHHLFCKDAVLPEHEEEIGKIRDRIKLTDKEEDIAEVQSIEQKVAEATKAERDASIAKLEKQHSHFSVNVFENFKGSGFWGRCARLTGVGVGAILMGKACTYDVHTDQEGKEPNPAIKYVDMAAGLISTVGSLCILPNKKGPQAKIIELLGEGRGL